MTMIGDRTLISSVYDRLLVEDDTEESVSGSDYHLVAILALYEVLLRYAHNMVKRWYVTAEVLVLADLPDRVRNPWRTLPDVYVVLDTSEEPRTSLDTRTGLSFPQFVCEVASESTWERDITEKQLLYADLGTQEYIVFDPTAEFLGQQVRAWRRSADGSWASWTPDTAGFLTSEVLGLRLRPEDTLLRVYDPALGRLPTGAELDQLARAQAEELEQARARLAVLEEEIARLRTDPSLEGNTK